jgi:hypothetical protein
MTEEEQQEYKNLTLKLFGDKEYIEADPEEPEIKRFISLRDRAGEESRNEKCL